MIALLNYKFGNIKAFNNVLFNSNINYRIIEDFENIKEFNKIIIPGVGHFKSAAKKIKKLKYFEKFNDLVLTEKIQVLGVCVGMQIFATESEEDVNVKGLNWIDTKIKKLNFYKLKFPHMGRNKIVLNSNDPIIHNIENNTKLYFLHSYAYSLSNKFNTLAYSEYGEKFSSIIRFKNIYGFQFHPEKSNEVGVKLIKNFCNLST